MSFPTKKQLKEVDTSFFEPEIKTVDDDFFTSDEKKNQSQDGFAVGGDGVLKSSVHTTSPLPSQENIKVTTAFDLPINKVPTVTTNDGVQFPVTETVNLVETENTPQSIQGLQSRITSKTVTPQDVEVLSKSSGKSIDAINAYIQGGQLVGGSVENIENVNKSKTKLETYIKDFNTIYGTEYDPNDILSSSQKTSDFLEIAKNKKAVPATDNINRPVSESTRMQVQQNAIPALLPTDISNEMISQVVSKTIDEDKVAGVPKDETIIKIAKRLNPKEFYKSVDAQVTTPSISGVNTVASLGELFRDNTSQDELFNYQKGVAELAYNQSFKQNSINKISQGVLSNDANMIEEGQHDLAQVDENVIDKYPALQKQEMVRRVNETIAQESGVVVGSDTESLREKVFGATIQDRARVLRDLGYFDNPKTKDAAYSLLANPSLFADNSVLGSVESSFWQPFKDLGMSVADISGIRNSKDIYSDKIRDELFPRDFAANANNPDAPQLKTGIRLARTTLNTTANLAGMLAISTATEGIATGLGASASLGQKLGAYTSFGLPSFDASLKDSKNFLDSEPAQYIYASINAIANAEGGRLLDLGKVTRIPGVSEDFAKIAKGFSENSITEDATRALLAEAKNKYIDFTVKYGKNVTKGAATMAYFTTANNIIKLGFGDQNVQAEDILPQAGHAFLDGVLGMSIMGGFGATADMRNERNTTYKGTIYNMALNHDAAKDIFDIGLKNGEYDKAEYDNKIAILNTAVSAKQFLDKAQSEANVELTPDQKAVFVGNKTAENVLRNQAENSILPKTKVNYEAQADKLKEQSEQILDGLKFTTTLEPLQNLYESEKVYNAALENFNPDNPESVTALETAKNNYDALNVKAEKDIPDTRLTEPIVGLDEQGEPIPTTEKKPEENTSIVTQPPQSFPEPTFVGGETKAEVLPTTESQPSTVKSEALDKVDDGIKELMDNADNRMVDAIIHRVSIKGIPFDKAVEDALGKNRKDIDEGRKSKIIESAKKELGINDDLEKEIKNYELDTPLGLKKYKDRLKSKKATITTLEKSSGDNKDLISMHKQGVSNMQKVLDYIESKSEYKGNNWKKGDEFLFDGNKWNVEEIFPYDETVGAYRYDADKKETVRDMIPFHAMEKSENKPTVKSEEVKDNDLMKDDKGEPVTFYHGTNKKNVTELEPSTAEQFGKGIYFGSDKNADAIVDFGDGGKIFEVHLPSKLLEAGSNEYGAIENKVEKDTGIEIGDKDFPIELVNDEIKKRGYKGVIANNDLYGGKEVMIFDKKDVTYKSENKPTVKSEAVPKEKIKVFRGTGRNVAHGENDSVHWVAEDRRVAENYSAEGKVEQVEVDKPNNPFEMPSDVIHVRGEDIGNRLRTIRDKQFKDGTITRERALEISKAIKEFEDGAGDKLELYSTKTNKQGASAPFVKVLKMLGFDGLVQKESYNSESPFTATKTGNETNTYGIFKESKSENKPIQNEESNLAEIKKLETERDEKIKEASRPEVKLDFIDESKLPKVETDATYKGEVVGKKMIADPKLIERQDNIKDRFEKLKDLLNCLTA